MYLVQTKTPQSGILNLKVKTASDLSPTFWANEQVGWTTLAIFRICPLKNLT